MDLLIDEVESTELLSPLLVCWRASLVVAAAAASSEFILLALWSTSLTAHSTAVAPLLVERYIQALGEIVKGVQTAIRGPVRPFELPMFSARLS